MYYCHVKHSIKIKDLPRVIAGEYGQRLVLPLLSKAGCFTLLIFSFFTQSTTPRRPPIFMLMFLMYSMIIQMMGVPMSVIKVTTKIHMKYKTDQMKSSSL